MSLSAETYLWEHWKFNADQRLKAFHFYVLFSIFADGVAFTAFDKHAHPLVMILLGGFVGVLALVFAIVDARSRHLLHMTKEGLMSFEQSLPLPCRPFQLDDIHRQRWVRYTVAFNLLFGMQCLFGAMLSAYGVFQW